MYTFSSIPTFALDNVEDNLDNKNTIESPVVFTNKANSNDTVKEDILEDKCKEEKVETLNVIESEDKYSEQYNNNEQKEPNAEKIDSIENTDINISTSKNNSTQYDFEQKKDIDLYDGATLSNDTTLSKLGFYSINGGLTEPFSPDKKEYKAILKGTSKSFIVNASSVYANHKAATMDVYLNDTLIFSKVKQLSYKEIILFKDVTNVMRIVVTAENGDQATYIVTFEREGSKNATLQSLKFYNDIPAIVEPFDPNKKDYTAILEGNSTTIITGTNFTRVADDYATMNIFLNDKLIFENVTATKFNYFNLTKGIDNVMRIEITSEHGVQDTYTISFKRSGYNNTNLSSLAFHTATITEAFDPSKKNYTAILAGSEKTVITGGNFIKVEDEYATMNVYLNDKQIFENVSGTYYAGFDLTKNISNIMKIIVTAENGDQTTYTVTFERENDSNTNITSLSLNKGELVLNEGKYTTVLNSWKDVTVSKIGLEDSWSSYRLILNDKKEVSLNEKFDLEIGDNKLDIEVTSNNGTKKTYPILFERSDNANPTVKYSLNNEDWTNENILINIEGSDDSGIRYIELPNGEKICSDKAEFSANQNGIYTLKVYDDFLNESIETVNVTNIDKKIPELVLKPSNTDLTNESVDIIIEAKDNSGIKYIETPDGKLNSKSTLTYNVKEDGEYTFKVVDLAGNEVTKSITINNIDNKNPLLTTELSHEDWVNEEITLSIYAMSEKGIKYIELPDGSKVEDNTAKYNIDENGVYWVSTESLGGNVTTEKVIVENIDTESPKLNLNQSTIEWTNEDVTITVDSIDNIGISHIILPNNQKVYDSSYDYVVNSNGTYEFSVVDLAGNITKESIEIKNIDKNPPIIANYDDLVTVTHQIITLDLSAIETLSEIYKVTLPNEEEIIEPSENIIEYEVEYNDTYTFTIINKAGNSVNIDVEVDALRDKPIDNNTNNNSGSGNNSTSNNTSSVVIPNTSGVNEFVKIISLTLVIVGAINIIKRKK